MAFDLNKNDGSGKDSSGKTHAASKFDLSKNEADVPVIADPSTKSKSWIIGLAGILIIGGGIWFYSSTSPKRGMQGSDVAGVNITDTAAGAISADSSVAVAADPSAGVQSDVVVTDTTDKTALGNEQYSLDNKVVNEPADGNAAKDLTVNKDVAKAAGLTHKSVAGFAQGSSAFSRVDQSLVKSIVSYLTENPDASININGYASSDGLLSVNKVVSQARADTFKELLISKNISASRIAAIGRGIENPIASNSTDAGRKKNRRIEITLP
jgi:outer membrane protein OmpA-like peptidoglycan-associated protein